MSVTLPVPETAPGPSDTSAADVWEGLWRYRPSAEKDDALLQRESRSPRFELILDRLQSTFGTAA